MLQLVRIQQPRDRQCDGLTGIFIDTKQNIHVGRFSFSWKIPVWWVCSFLLVSPQWYQPYLRVTNHRSTVPSNLWVHGMLCHEKKNLEGRIQELLVQARIWTLEHNRGLVNVKANTHSETIIFRFH